MNNLQKETIFTLLKTDKKNNNYTNNYWLAYKDYLDPTDDSTDFCCECLEGKHDYLALIFLMNQKIYFQVILEKKQIFQRRLFWLAIMVS